MLAHLMLCPTKNLFSPTGGTAKGIPKKYSARPLLAPLTTPYCVCTWTEAELEVENEDVRSTTIKMYKLIIMQTYKYTNAICTNQDK